MSEHCEHCIDNCPGVLWQSENTRVAVVHHNGAGVSWWHDCPFCAERSSIAKWLAQQEPCEVYLDTDGYNSFRMIGTGTFAEQIEDGKHNE